MLFCQHGSTENGLFIGKLETDVLGSEVVNEYIPDQGDSFKNTKFVIMDFNKHKAWLLEDDWIYFNIVRRNGNSYKPNIIVANCNYKEVYFDDYLENIKYHKDKHTIENTFCI